MHLELRNISVVSSHSSNNKTIYNNPISLKKPKEYKTTIIVNATSVAVTASVPALGKKLFTMAVITPRNNPSDREYMKEHTIAARSDNLPTNAHTNPAMTDTANKV